ncbi:MULTISPECIES: DUF2909 family protein [Deefgea]|uniref:DUF2909 family protein n=1 Tax=Deefgea piscis TaxID=2739061 RepID=A0A6M8SLQ3_9NEIS|nr:MULTISPECIES: DUF2909 family protein [Deefgea]MBM5574118.1 DUF2909 family protein [Deefgea sp. CFH1-16]QKJ66095.1 DUF2909 family protein [Deefgea piscis]
MKIVLIGLLLTIMALLALALTQLIRGGSQRLFTLLAWRVGLSIGLFLFLMLSRFMGWI